MPSVPLASDISLVLIDTGLCLFCSLLTIKYSYFAITEIMYPHLRSIFKRFKQNPLEFKTEY
jgi:hypothetical protein